MMQQEKGVPHRNIYIYETGSISLRGKELVIWLAELGICIHLEDIRASMIVLIMYNYWGTSSQNMGKIRYVRDCLEAN